MINAVLICMILKNYLIQMNKILWKLMLLLRNKNKEGKIKKEEFFIPNCLFSVYWEFNYFNLIITIIIIFYK